MNISREAVNSGIVWPIVSSEDSTNYILVDVDAEGMRNLLGDSHVPETPVALLHLDDGRDEFRGRTFGTGFSAMR
jgi:hypothetical protein